MLHHSHQLPERVNIQERLRTSPTCDPQEVPVGSRRCPRILEGNHHAELVVQIVLLKSSANLHSAHLEFQILGLINTLLT